MKANEIDIELLLNIIFHTPEGYDINSIDFIDGNIKVNTSFDYNKAQKEYNKAQADRALKELLEISQSLDDYNSKVANGEIVPNKSIGWKRQLEACYNPDEALRIETELKPKKRGRPRKSENKAFLV